MQVFIVSAQAHSLHGDDGFASVWAPIESKPFLDHVLTWIGADKDDYWYGATIDHIRQALEPVRAELLDEITPREQALIDDPDQWDRPITSAWWDGVGR